MLIFEGNLRSGEVTEPLHRGLNPFLDPGPGWAEQVNFDDGLRAPGPLLPDALIGAVQVSLDLRLNGKSQKNMIDRQHPRDRTYSPPSSAFTWLTQSEASAIPFCPRNRFNWAACSCTWRRL
jgi:hypothetical protein